MGKKGSWFSAIKRVFIHKSKDKPTDGSSDKKSSKEKQKGKGVLKHGETKSFIPLFRKPSSIEKILGEADQLLIRPTSPQAASPKAASPQVASPKAASPKVASPKVASPKATSPKAVSPKAVSRPKAFTSEASSSKAAAVATSKITESRNEIISYVPRPEPTLRNQDFSATKIQAAYRGYLARRSFRGLRGLVRLQEAVRGQNVKRQTVNAMKQMQLLVRVQSQIQSRRIQMLENQAVQRQADREVESTLSKWTSNQISEAGETEDWDGSALTKEEEEARLQKKVEAVIKRERAMAYAYSHQLWKNNPKSAEKTGSNGYPWWWNWLERQLPPTASTSQSQSQTPPRRPISEYNPSPRSSSRSAAPIPSNFKSPNYKYAKSRASNSAYNNNDNDNDSLASCPPFLSTPSYMTPTVSAKAKARANSNPKERLGTPGNSNASSRRFSYPLTPPNFGSNFKWSDNKGTNNKKGVSKKHESSRSIGDDLSVDSAVSMPATVGTRKPFNRFV